MVYNIVTSNCEIYYDSETIPPNARTHTSTRRTRYRTVARTLVRARSVIARVDAQHRRTTETERGITITRFDRPNSFFSEKSNDVVRITWRANAFARENESSGARGSDVARRDRRRRNRRIERSPSKREEPRPAEVRVP